MTGEIIELYLKDYPYPSCLVLGVTTSNKYMYVVRGCNGEIIKIITAYYPTTDKFESDLKTLKELKKWSALHVMTK